MCLLSYPTFNRWIAIVICSKLFVLMSDWTSKHAIMRDLAEAQGFDVPADLEGIGANEKPPALNIPEGTDMFLYAYLVCYG